jgi:hypothetical protein
MRDEDVPHHSAISPFSPKTAPPSSAIATALRGIFVDVRKFESHFQVADGLEAMRGRLQRLVDIGCAMRRGQEHVVLGMKERAMA